MDVAAANGLSGEPDGRERPRGNQPCLREAAGFGPSCSSPGPAREGAGMPAAAAAPPPAGSPEAPKEPTVSSEARLAPARPIFRAVLGSDFDRLHPKVAERYSHSSSSGLYSAGRGTMDRVWNGSPLFRPFLLIGSRRNVMFPECAPDVPFRVENWAYRDSFGRETLSLNRTFEFGNGKTRRFDEFVVLDRSAPTLLIYVGNHQHLVVELNVGVTPEGGLELTTGRQRLLTRGASLRFPLALSAQARIREWYDERTDRLRIDGRVRNRLLGDVFCCVGSFESRTLSVPETGVPRAARPLKEDHRW